MTSPVPVDPADEDLTSVERTLRMLGRSAEEDDPDPVVAEAVAAVNSLVPTWLTKPAAGWAQHHHFGATMLAARLYRKKDAIGELAMDGAAYVGSNWSDVAMLLGIGSYGVGRVG